MTDQEILGLRAFVVEDQQLVSSALIDALNQFGISVVRQVKDLPAALSWLDEDKPFDLALIDLILPSGLAFPIIDRLRDMAVRTLLVTAFNNEEIPEAYKKVPYLQKPFGMHDLLALIRTM